MAHYRLHYLDALEGSTIRVRQLEAESDDAAIAYSEQVRSLTAMELWQADRRIRQWDCFPPSASDK